MGGVRERSRIGSPGGNPMCMEITSTPPYDCTGTGTVLRACLLLCVYRSQVVALLHRCPKYWMRWNCFKTKSNRNVASVQI